MPTHSRTSLPEIVSTGRALVESDGPDRLTMQRLAKAVGVKAPSLYKHVDGRDHLIRLIAEDVVADLIAALDEAVSGIDPREDLGALAHALRHFAHANPEAYGLLFSQLPEEQRPDAALLEQGVAALLRTTEALAGEDDALEAARTVTAWGHGFITMELAGAFRLGGDVDRAFEFGLDRLVTVLAESTPLEAPTMPAR
ncbi:MAG TPA: TetR-like C-terminal domain-containing protein [Acidimicrobiia bacterium]